MKKILSVSIIALFAIMPSLTLAARDNYDNLEYDGFTVLSDEDYNKLNDAEKAVYDEYLQTAKEKLLPADGTNDAEGVYFGLKQAKDGDGTNVATAQYVKGAFNQLTKRINRVYKKTNDVSDKEYEALVNVCQSWDEDTCDGEADVSIFEKGKRPSAQGSGTTTGGNEPPAGGGTGGGE